ncbi:MAG: adenosylcobalamin-dependent ribonucleoside-diphosphate reductase [Candidatus Shapirobacteria bacterium]|nr:adenosylcobalamin-dependent ribonucleoside-diphosphate reductase [Candidatus Shapirobacteria bacterium]
MANKVNKNYNKQENLWERGRKIPPLPKNLPEAKLTATGEYIACNNYLIRDSEGKTIEKPKEMFWRVAHNVATADLLYESKQEMVKTREEFYKVLSALEFVPNTPTFANAGGRLQQLSACFVLPVEDSLQSIGQTFVDTMMIHKTGGGTGFSFSRLRPHGSIVRSTGRVSSGAIYFMWMYADATDRVQQGGYRRGANMGVMNIEHPDILRWIMIKSSEFTVNSFNLSVAITDKFMEQVEKDSQFTPDGLKSQKEEFDNVIGEIQRILGSPELNFNDRMKEFEAKIIDLKALLLAKEPGEGYDLVNPDTKQSEGKLNAKKVFELIGRVAWEKGDPGVIFIDKINIDNPTPHLGQIEATNPCGEQPLLPYESCNLGAINLSRMIKENKSGFGEIDYEKIKTTIQTAVHFLDNVIDMNRYPIPQIEKMTKGNRKVGMGVMGWADMLVQLGIPYDSPEALNTASQLMNFIREEARKTSLELAKKRGVFLNFKGSIYDKKSRFFKGQDLRLRNATLTTIAPTGTTSMLADASSGVEPYFAIRYEKNIVTGERVVNLNPFFVKLAKEKGFWQEDLVEKIKNNKGSLKGLKEIPEEIQKLFPIASDIAYEDHIKMQAAFQKAGVDNAVSKTINMSSDVMPQDVIQSYLLAYNEGCKGVTIYRDRSRNKQILERDTQLRIDGIILRKINDVRYGRTWSIHTPVGKLHATINEDENGNPYEIFFNVGKAGGDILAVAEGLGRLISLTLRTTPPKLSLPKLKMIREQIVGIGGSSSVGFGPNKVRSLPDAIAKLIGYYLEEKQGKNPIEADLTEGQQSIFSLPVENNNHGNLCPKCGNATLIYEEGCEKCICGYAKC